METVQVLVRRAVRAARGLYAREPVRVAAAVVSAVVFVAAKAGLVLDAQTTAVAAAIVLPILLGGEVARKKVTPV